ncbi:hypothetical protein BH10ACT7_BH10ACT7_06070 [soil metagenome]
MNESEGSKPTTSDERLVEQTRAGDERAFAELWRRHYRSGARVARQFTSSLDADDLVSEAYTRIYQRVLAGGGPTGAFRPYLYTTIRNLASSWGASSKDVQVDDITDFEDPQTIDDPIAFALDRTLTATAFRALPERWQSVLWYTEVEGLDPHEVAPLLGMSANGVAALSYRAREGLRKAWLQAHVTDAGSGDCHWAISRIGEHARNGLTARESERMNAHLADCQRCAIINEEVDEVGSRLAMVMIPLLLGGVAGGSLLASMGQAGSSLASTASAIPAMPDTIIAGGTAIAGGAAGLFATAAPAALVGTLAIAVAVTGGVVVLAPADPPTTSASSSQDGTSADSSETVSASSSADVPLGLDNPAHVPDGVGTVLRGLGSTVDELGNVVGGVTSGVGEVVGGVTGTVGTVVDEVVEPVVEAVIPPEVATVDVGLSGHGVPGATVTATVGGVVYASTTIGGNGAFSLYLSGVPQGSSVQLKQGGLMGLLGIPLSLDGGVLGVVVNLLN